MGNYAPKWNQYFYSKYTDDITQKFYVSAKFIDEDTIGHDSYGTKGKWVGTKDVDYRRRGWQKWYFEGYPGQFNDGRRRRRYEGGWSKGWVEYEYKTFLYTGSKFSNPTS